MYKIYLFFSLIFQIIVIHHQVYPYNSKNSRHLLPAGTFLTCSSDDTIRIWNTEVDMNSSKATSYIYKKNFFSPELMKILYMDPDLTYLCDQDLAPTKSNSNGNGSVQNSDQYDSKNGIRAIKFSTDGKHLASGFDSQFFPISLIHD